MASLLFRCPITAREIDLGIEIDFRALSLNPFFALRRRCPECGAFHSWHAMEGRIEEPDTGLHPESCREDASRHGPLIVLAQHIDGPSEASCARRKLADELITVLTHAGVHCELWIGGEPVGPKTCH